MRIEVRGIGFDVQVIDSTHVNLTVVGGTGRGWAYHLGQLDSETLQSLRSAGVLNERGYAREAK